MRGSKRLYENEIAGAVERLTACDHAGSAAVYCRVSPQSPTESGLGITEIVSPIRPLSADTDSMPRRVATRHCPRGPRARRSKGSAWVLSTGQSFGER